MRCPVRCLAAVRSVEGFFAFVWLRDLLVVGNSMSFVCVSLHDCGGAVLSCTALPLCCAVLCTSFGNFIWPPFCGTCPARSCLLFGKVGSEGVQAAPAQLVRLTMCVHRLDGLSGPAYYTPWLC